MNTILKSGILTAIAIAASTSVVYAQSDTPEIKTFQPLYGGGLKAMSQNGLWAVGDAPNPTNGSYNAFPRLVDTTTGETKELFSEQEGNQQLPMGASCVSNDGKTVGGDYLALPAVWKEGQGWLHLPMPEGGYTMGLVSAITPDGRYAVGRVSIDLFREHPCLWDLQSMSLMETPGMITSNPRYSDMIAEGGDPEEWIDEDVNVRLTGITPDGRTLLGMVDFAYPSAAWEFIYSLDTNSWTPLGMTYENGKLTPTDEDIYNVDECVFSADGSWIGGLYYSMGESFVPFSCPTDSPGDYTLHKDGDGIGVWAIGSDGVPYGASPFSTPVRNWSAKVGKYWYDWKMVARQIYDIDWLEDVAKDEIGNTGTVCAVSADNKTILATDWAGRTSYIIRLPKSMTEICQEVDLLGDFKVYPDNGAEFSMLQTVTLQMGRDVDVLCGKTDAYVLDADGNRVRNSINIATQADNKGRVEITFRNFTLDPGKHYTVVLPAGALCVADDQERPNKEISINYTGRENKPVALVSASPEDGASVARINLTTNPVMLTFDAVLGIGEQPYVGLYQISDGQEEFLYPLSATIDGRDVMVYPVSEQRLAEGNDYRIEFGAGTVTDLSGAGANEAFSITYHGSYVPEIDPNSNVIFRETFDTGVAAMMLFDGDGYTPTAEMAGYDFTATGRPWIPVRDEDDTEGNFAAASHSCYEPAGASDDWMVTPQLFIPDDKATLSFKSQSFRKDKKDMLRVYVWPTDEVVTIMTSGTADKMRYNGDLVYYELQTPGESEDNLAGDWRINNVDLSAYAGQNIYIAFVNDNRNQSMVFVDDVLVSREILAAISIDTPATMVDADNTSISGRLQVMKDVEGHGYDLILYDADHKEIERIAADCTIEKDYKLEFDFNKKIDLKKGDVNTLFVEFAAGGESVEKRFDIRNLKFETTRRIVLEEYTGNTCVFCPQGILGIEHMKQIYGDLFIPIAIHSYTGDMFGSAEQSAYSSFLNMYAAPSGVINRGEITTPMYSDGSDYIFTAPDGMTWLQHADAAMTEYADADIEITSAKLDKEDNLVKVALDINYALDNPNATVNLFGVLMEDGLFGVQANALATIEAPGLGEWGKGGAYGNSAVVWYFDDVVRGTSASVAAGTYVGFNGRGGLVPTDIKAGEKMTVDFSFQLPSGISDMDKTKVCVMMIEANSGKMINAAISATETNAVEGIGSDDSLPSDITDISGRVVKRDASQTDLDTLEKGIYIFRGRKYVVK